MAGQGLIFTKVVRAVVLRGSLAEAVWMNPVPMQTKVNEQANFNGCIGL